MKESWTLSGVHAQEREIFSESTRAEVAGSLELSKSFDGQLLILARPAFRFITGRDQDVFSERLPKDKIYADEAKIAWTPTPGGVVEAGALNQSHLDNNLLVDNRPFPAARLEYGGGERTRLKGAAQIAIPSSYTLEAQATDNEELPKLQTYSLVLEQLIGNASSVDFGVTYFAFSALPQIVAVTSTRLGNSTNLQSSTTGNFLYDYQGIALQAGAQTSLGPWAFEWKGKGIRNSSAPSRLGTGFVSSIETKRRVWTAHQAGLAFSYYRVQPDTSPAYYSDEIFSNNRIGAGASAFVNHLRWGLQFKASFYQDTPYYRKDSVMGDRNLFLISVGNLSDEKAIR